MAAMAGAGRHRSGKRAVALATVAVVAAALCAAVAGPAGAAQRRAHLSPQRAGFVAQVKKALADEEAALRALRRRPPDVASARALVESSLRDIALAEQRAKTISGFYARVRPDLHAIRLYDRSVIDATSSVDWKIQTLVAAVYRKRLAIHDADPADKAGIVEGPPPVPGLATSTTAATTTAPAATTTSAAAASVDLGCAGQAGPSKTYPGEIDIGFKGCSAGLVEVSGTLPAGVPLKDISKAAVVSPPAGMSTYPCTISGQTWICPLNPVSKPGDFFVVAIGPAPPPGTTIVFNAKTVDGRATRFTVAAP